jgi:hypothetical protein
MQLTVMQTLDDAMKLLQRFDKGQGFKRYVTSRMRIVVPAAALILATGIVFASGLIVLAGPRVWLALPALILAPLMMLGSVLLQAYLWLSWLENRAVAKAVGHPSAPPGPIATWLRKNLRAEMLTPPAVPWDLAAIFIALPLVILIAVSWKIAAIVVVLHLAAPVAYARLDRGT